MILAAIGGGGCLVKYCNYCSIVVKVVVIHREMMAPFVVLQHLFHNKLGRWQQHAV